jgi:hypothetical protein
MTVYLASPHDQVQASACSGMPVLLSFAKCNPFILDYQRTFSRILLDSGAYSELNSGKTVDLEAYREWSQKWIGHADAIAGLDDIRGDWRRSMSNYEAIPWSFPTWHDSDPVELVDDLVGIAKERGRWLGIGLVPPREGKEPLIRKALERVPEGIHVHGWALRAYTHIRRLNSVDSTNWWRDALKVKAYPLTKHLTYPECLEIVVKRYQRWNRQIVDRERLTLFEGLENDDATLAGG